MHLYIIRHGQSMENRRGWDGSNSNSALTELGQAQAAALGEWFAQHVKLDQIYASPMQRARQTAECLAAAMQMEAVIFDNRLREVGNSYPDGLPFPDDQLPLYFMDRWGSLHPYKSITEKGENWMHFRARVGGFLEWLIDTRPEDHLDYAVAVVCHGGVIEGFFEHVFQKGPWSAVMVNSHNTGVTHLEYHPSVDKPSWWLHYHNSTRHLAMDQIS